MKEYLFSLNANETLSEKIKSISQFQLSGVAGSTIFSRGIGYFEDGAVYDEVEVEMGKIELTVSGSYGEYSVEIEQKNHKVEAECDCPYDDGVCKHIIASLLHLKHNTPESALKAVDITTKTIQERKTKEDAFEAYVNGLDLEQLRALVLKFAPKSYRKEIEIKSKIKKGGNKSVLQSFGKVQNSFDNLFDDDLYDISGFERDVERLGEKLKPFWTTLPNEVTTLICDFFENVDNAFDEGYLYDDYGDDSYEGDDFGIYTAEFITALPNEHRKKAIEQIFAAKEELGYAVFDNLAVAIVEEIPDNEWSVFKEVVIQVDFLNYLNGENGLALYQKIEPYLSEKEKENILTNHSNNPHLNFVLANLYEKKKAFKKAYQSLENYLKNQEKASFFYRSNSIRHQQFQMIVRLCKQYFNGENVLKWLKKYIEVESSVQAFQFAVKELPEERPAFETFFEQNHLFVFTQILETENRLTEVVELFKKYDQKFAGGTVKYQFFQRHKRSFPDEAIMVFKKELAVASVNTGDRHYYKVAECLEHLKPILPKQEFANLVSGIRKKYYRRRNLLAILAKKGF